MRKTILMLAVFTISTLSLIAQTEATTKDGKKVILNENGSWEYDENIKTEKSVTLDCSKLISTDTDKMTGKSSTSSKKVLMVSKNGGKNGFGIFLMKGSSGTIIISTQAVGAGGCIDDDDKMNVLFRDGTRMELVNNGKFNCKSKFTLYFGNSFGKKKELEMLRTKEIETMRIWTSKSYVEEDFTPEQGKELMQTIVCLLNNE
ncbi:hypothetical protein [Psychroserpens burtonensis]|uniref:hypothetical protein n=1 Tax=Psychroserpens burtonensis TaxID=49278 RepID=UPI00048FD18C|nr:hypothetical protein [Psychroserpens burtonensis]